MRRLPARSTNTRKAAGGSDPDSDLLSNLLEHALGTDPNIASPAALPQSNITAGKFSITFTRNTAATDLTTSVMVSDHLTSDWTEIARSTHVRRSSSTNPDPW